MTENETPFLLDHVERFAVARLTELAADLNKRSAALQAEINKIETARADFAASLRIRHNLPADALINITNIEKGEAVWTPRPAQEPAQ